MLALYLLILSLAIRGDALAYAIGLAFVVVSARHPRDEKDRVAVRMNELNQEQLQDSGYFWVDHDHAVALVTLQDRASHVLQCLKKVQSFLKYIYQMMFPLDVVPSSLLALLAKFQDLSAVRDCV